MAINRKWIIGLVMALVFVVLLAQYLDRVPKRHYCDFQVYYHTALKFLAREDIYFRDTMAVTPFKYSPFFAFCFAPFGFMPIKVAASLFFTINFILTFILFYLASVVTESRIRLMALSGKMLGVFYGLGILFLLRFVFLVWDSGQVTILMCVLLLAGLGYLSKGKNVPAGVFLAAGILIKCTPAIFLPYLLVRRQFKAVAWTMLFIVIWLLIPALAVGVHKEIAYLFSWIPSMMETSLDKWSYMVPKNQSLISMAIRFFSNCGFGINVGHLTFEQGKFLGYALAAFLYLLALIPPFRKPRDQEIDYALLFSFLPLFNPNGWEINFVALAVPCMLLIGYLIEVKWKDFFVVACMGVGFIATSLMARDIVGNDMHNLGGLYSNVTIGTLLLVVALLKLKFVGRHQS
jgi:hypothetical protein